MTTAGTYTQNLGSYEKHIPNFHLLHPSNLGVFLSNVLVTSWILQDFRNLLVTRTMTKIGNFTQDLCFLKSLLFAPSIKSRCFTLKLSGHTGHTTYHLLVLPRDLCQHSHVHLLLLNDESVGPLQDRVQRGLRGFGGLGVLLARGEDVLEHGVDLVTELLEL